MADLLSLGRGLLALPFGYLMLQTHAAAAWAAAALLGLAIVSDLCDGPIARRRGTVSARGRTLDHGADVLFVLAGLGPAAWRGAVPLTLPLVVGVAFVQYAIDSYWLHREGQLRMSALGRWNGILYFVPIVIDVVARVPHLNPRTAGALEGLLHVVAWALIATSLLSMLDRLLSLRVPEA